MTRYTSRSRRSRATHAAIYVLCDDSPHEQTTKMDTSEYSQMWRSTRHIQVRIHDPVVYGIAQVRGERLPERRDELVELAERGAVADGDQAAGARPRALGREGVVRVALVHLRAEAQVERLHAREEHRRLDEQDERVRLSFGVRKEHVGVVRPLPVGGGHEDLRVG